MAINWPDRVERVMAIAATAAMPAQNLAFQEVGRQAIMADPDWQGGAYYGTGRAPDAGLSVARMAAHVTYLSEATLSEKFGRRLQDRAAHRGVPARLEHEQGAQVVGLVHHVQTLVVHGGAREYADPARDDARGHALGVGVDCVEDAAGTHAGTLFLAYASGATNSFVRAMPAARPFAEITRAILRLASSIISSPSMTAPRAPPSAEV